MRVQKQYFLQNKMLDWPEKSKESNSIQSFFKRFRDGVVELYTIATGQKMTYLSSAITTDSYLCGRTGRSSSGL